MSGTSKPTKVRVIVAHGGYGCDTGCCGHWVELEDTGEQIGGFNFSHPRYGKDDFRAWALEMAQDEVTARFGADHVADLDWENSVVCDD